MVELYKLVSYFMSHSNCTSGIVSFIVGIVPRVNNRLTEIGLCL